MTMNSVSSTDSQATKLVFVRPWRFLYQRIELEPSKTQQLPIRFHAQSTILGAASFYVRVVTQKCRSSMQPVAWWEL